MQAEVFNCVILCASGVCLERTVSSMAAGPGRMKRPVGQIWIQTSAWKQTYSTQWSSAVIREICRWEQKNMCRQQINACCKPLSLGTVCYTALLQPLLTKTLPTKNSCTMKNAYALLSSPLYSWRNLNSRSLSDLSKVRQTVSGREINTQGSKLNLPPTSPGPETDHSSSSSSRPFMTSWISSRHFSWYSGYLAKLNSTQDSPLDVVSWPVGRWRA